jgi:hypothetical protein
MIPAATRAQEHSGSTFWKSPRIRPVAARAILSPRYNKRPGKQRFLVSVQSLWVFMWVVWLWVVAGLGVERFDGVGVRAAVL